MFDQNRIKISKLKMFKERRIENTDKGGGGKTIKVIRER